MSIVLPVNTRVGLRACDSSADMSLSTRLTATRREIVPLRSSFMRTAEDAEYVLAGEADMRE